MESTIYDRFIVAMALAVYGGWGLYPYALGETGIEPYTGYVNSSSAQAGHLLGLLAVMIFAYRVHLARDGRLLELKNRVSSLKWASLVISAWFGAGTMVTLMVGLYAFVLAFFKHSEGDPGQVILSVGLILLVGCAINILDYRGQLRKEDELMATFEEELRQMRDADIEEIVDLIFLFLLGKGRGNRKIHALFEDSLVDYAAHKGVILHEGRWIISQVARDRAEEVLYRFFRPDRRSEVGETDLDSNQLRWAHATLAELLKISDCQQLLKKE